MDAVILAGGQGKRLRPLTNDIPKCMIRLNRKPMIEYHIEGLKKYGIEQIIVACGYKWGKIRERYGDKFIYSVEEEPLGTAGALKLALKHVSGNEFVVVNADDINNVDIKKLVAAGSNATVISQFHSQFGIVELQNGFIKEFKEKPLLPFWANMGMHFLSKKVPLPDRGSLEQNVLPKLAAAGRLKAFKHTGYWITINTVKEMEEAERRLREVGL